MYKKVIALAALMALSSFAQAQTMQEFEQARVEGENIYTLISRGPSATSESKKVAKESKKVANDLRESLGHEQLIIALIYSFGGKYFQKEHPSLAKGLKISDLSKVKQDISKSVLYAKMSCKKGNEGGCMMLKGAQKDCDNGNKDLCEFLNQ